MPAPVTPNDFKAVIPSPTSTLCGQFVSVLLKMPVLLYRLVNWMFDAAGNPTNDFVSLVLHSGDLILSASPNEDSSRLLCDGREVSRSTYDNLFAAVGVTYGTPSSGSVFKLPDYRARFPVGVGVFSNAVSAVLGQPDGAPEHTLTAAEGVDPNHTHSVGRFNSQNGLYILAPSATPTDTGSGYDEKGDGNPTTTGQVDTQTGPWCATGKVIGDPVAGPHPQLPPYLPCYILIKT